MIKKTKRLHQLYQDWIKLKDMPKPEGLRDIEEKYMGKGRHWPSMWDQPLAGKWYYTYSNEKGMAVGLAKLQDVGVMFNGKYRRKWMWETCTANEELELRRFPTQKAAEKSIYKFLK